MRGFYGRLKIGERVMFWWLVFWWPGIWVLSTSAAVITQSPDWFGVSGACSVLFGFLGSMVVFVSCADDAFGTPWLERVMARELPSKTADLEAQIARMDDELRRLGAR